jgi:hypothetical protein
VGKIERLHREINVYLRHYMNLDLNEWDEWLPICAFAYNVTPSSIHSYTPYELLFGNRANLPDELFNGKITPCYDWENYAMVTKFKLNIMLERAKHLILESKLRNKNNCDRKANVVQLNLNDDVYITNESRRKMDPFYIGPFKIIKILENNNIEILDPLTKKTQIIHKNRVKK